MSSDLYTGTLLKVLAASKPKSRFLELGTGIGLSLSWIIDGMDKASKVISIDNDQKLISIASNYFYNDPRVEIICTDGGEWLRNFKEEKFDLIFADTWPGKYTDLEAALDLLNPGGIYMVDDMNPQPGWPEGHKEKASKLRKTLQNRKDFAITELDWSTGIIICTKMLSE